MSGDEIKRWTNTEILKLIKEYGKRPALWDSEHLDFNNRGCRPLFWAELGEIFKCTGLEVKRKITSLTAQHRRERLKDRKMKAVGKHYVSQWYAYEPLAFLRRGYRGKRITNAVKEESSREESFSIEDTDDPLQELVECDNVQMTCYNNGPDSALESTKVEEAGLESHVECFSNKERDEWDLFGQLMVLSLRKLPDDRSRCIVKHRINTILYEAELAGYDK